MDIRVVAALYLWVLFCTTSTPTATSSPFAPDASETGHTSNWAVIVSTSRYWFNYRHASDALSFYHIVRRLGIPDSNIILMLADDFACNARNSHPGKVFNNGDHSIDLYGEAIQVDYRGTEVSVHAFLRVLTGRHPEAYPPSKRLQSDSGSNVLVYLSGHGGDDFLKFQDQQEMMGADLADAIAQMAEAKRYRRMLLFVETCEAESLAAAVTSPNVITIATSKLGEKSYSHHSDMDVGLHVIDRVTYHALEWFRSVGPTSRATLEQLLEYVKRQPLGSTLTWDDSRFPVPPSQIPVLDFFGSSPRVVPFPMSSPVIIPISSVAENGTMYISGSDVNSSSPRAKACCDAAPQTLDQKTAKRSRQIDEDTILSAQLLQRPIGDGYCASSKGCVNWERGWPTSAQQVDIEWLVATAAVVLAACVSQVQPWKLRRIFQ